MMMYHMTLKPILIQIQLKYSICICNLIKLQNVNPYQLTLTSAPPTILYPYTHNISLRNSRVVLGTFFVLSRVTSKPKHLYVSVSIISRILIGQAVDILALSLEIAEYCELAMNLP